VASQAASWNRTHGPAAYWQHPTSTMSPRTHAGVRRSGAPASLPLRRCMRSLHALLRCCSDVGVGASGALQRGVAPQTLCQHLLEACLRHHACAPPFQALVA
jgi:hypothetical protein